MIIDWISSVGRFILQQIRSSGRGMLLLLAAVMALVYIPRRRKEIGRLLFIVGIRSFAVVTVVALFIGMILTLQTGLELRKFGQEVNVGLIVAETMCREMGPFMSALILAASVGAAFAAELGTMVISEEIDALQLMSINPAEYVVMPRLLALLLMCPVLTIYANCIGIAGAGLVANTQLDVSWQAFYQSATRSLDHREIFVGLFKSMVFAVIITGVSCYQGISTRDGAIGVGWAARNSVVLSFLLILIVGYFLTRFFF